MSLLNEKYLFVHINKSGGGVITNNMKANGKTKITGRHRSLDTMLSIAKHTHKLDIHKLFTFTMVRNPFDRMLSMYLFYHKNNFNCAEFYSGSSEIDDDFNKWIEYIYSDMFDKTLMHGDVNVFSHCFCNQLNWIKDESGKIMKIDKILKYECDEYNNLFKEILKLNNYDYSTVVHPTIHNHYSEYYTEKSIELVSSHYSEDLEYFNYCFTRNIIKS
jgi:hypothetical protein